MPTSSPPPVALPRSRAAARRLAFPLLCLVVLALPPAAAGSEAAGPLELRDGDALVFLGDSITHRCRYTQYLETYFYTRHPERRIRFHNAGVTGDTAADALVRFERDVAARRPTHVTVLLGMNDGGFRHFDRAAFDRYEADMTALIERLEKTGARTILLGPSAYDARVSARKPPFWIAKDPVRSREATDYYAAVLAFYAAWLRDLSDRRGLPWVDLQSPLHRLLRQRRREHPDFTLIPDAVHPDADGHAVMAAAILSQLGASRQVSSLEASRVDDTWRVDAGGSGEVSDVAGGAASLAFTFAARALPWVLPREARRGFALAGAGRELSRERLRVTGLAPGRYRLSIQGQPIGTFTHRALAGGLGLQGNERTPQYQRALEVALLNRARNEKAVRPARDQWKRLRGRKGETLDAEARAEVERQIATLEALAADYEAKIRIASQPAAQRYELAPGDG